ncbi:Copper transport ATP-binding protein NosF (plasmid) [Cupriavidus necator H16]|uniref:ABC transporter ATP-binding protein n=1 Tax=Cupriavidus necator (strain ATCC 17699 / DSM 428 / KCTC 22496 / NCIMB 10442 / H16 / Stanier 337) TaxID=381666 RepID=Q7WX92_CUPNH|nr:ABC transporter ATP-binding protein [Cupriavidus necator]AAP85998.1 putative copper ATP-binding ABC transporter [Cupriavidus necator H16]QCC05482.1 ABC transporter ATP-binding protein [Cupriavidus necator H16]QQB81303.1 ABC transporter ATP-binding protein [Cupriavidus necator]
MTSITPAADGCAIELRDVTRHYGAVRAVDGVDLQVRRGEMFGLIGHNGAGKSTLFRMMLGLVPATGGELTVDGACVRSRAFRAARRHIGYLPENLVLYDNLSGLETLRFFARLKRADAGDCQMLLERVGLAAAGKRPVREYSKGMRQRLGFAQALLGSPRVLFLDEPSNGLDPAAIRDFYAMLRALREQGVTIVMTSHILAELQERVDRLAIMANGRVRALGSVAQLREQNDMPLTLALRVEPDMQPALRERLAAVPVLGWQATGAEIELRCPRTAKMTVLSLLAGDVQDLQIREPSLEDLFFGLGG